MSANEQGTAALLARECSFCRRTARWVVEGDLHAFRARACGVHTHQALDLALLAGNPTTRVRSAINEQGASDA